MSWALDVLVLATGYTHVLLAPYTKVEESFNLHAVHDVLMYGVFPSSLHNYDHFMFPGAVPRTFLGSVILAWLSRPIINLAIRLGLVSSKFQIQIVVRLVLASFNSLGLCLLRRAVSHRFGRPTGLMYTLLTISQFHVPFWMGRTLPNMFALFPVNMASYLLINRAPNSLMASTASFNTAISLLVFTAVVFRAEILLLLGPFALQSLAQNHTTLWNLVKIGLISGVFSLVMTTLVDSYFWNKWPIWPEFVGMYFNVYEGKSAEWGTSPPQTYLTTHLPKLLLGSLPLSVIGAILEARIRSMFFPPIAFISLMSALGHKEWRFIVYVIPLVNIGAASGAKWMVSRKKGTWFGRFTFLAAVMIMAANCLATVLFTISSIANYPGGFALSTLNKAYTGDDPIHVHISNLATQTGASLFLQVHSSPYYGPNRISPTSHWTYNKTESLSPAFLTASKHFTHLIVESESDVGTFVATGNWQLVEPIEAYDRWTWGILWRIGPELDSGLKLLELKDLLPNIVTKEQLWILTRKV